MEDQQKLRPTDVLEFIQAGNLGMNLDWEAYFQEFSRRNGGDPVRINMGGVIRLLFRTGWGYGTKYEGPEYPPPEDPRKRHSLVRFYWRTRKAALVEIQGQLSESVSSLQAMQSSRSVPLQVREIMWDDQQHKPVTRSGDIHLGRLYERLENLDRLIAECDSYLDVRVNTEDTP